MTTSELVYQGELRTIATHSFSGTQIFMDAPLDNHGKAQSFSPTDLVCTALASCMITIIGIEAERIQLDISGSKLSVIKKMQANPRRISEVHIHVEIYSTLIDETIKRRFEQLAHSCPVALSLHPDIKQVITFTYSA